MRSLPLRSKDSVVFLESPTNHPANQVSAAVNQVTSAVNNASTSIANSAASGNSSVASGSSNATTVIRRSEKERKSDKQVMD